MDTMTDSEKRTLSDKFMLRLPDGMRDRIKSAADKNNRSMNAEILAAIESWINRPTPEEVERDANERLLEMLKDESAATEARMASLSQQMKEVISRLDRLKEE